MCAHPTGALKPDNVHHSNPSIGSPVNAQTAEMLNAGALINKEEAPSHPLHHLLHLRKEAVDQLLVAQLAVAFAFQIPPAVMSTGYVMQTANPWSVPAHLVNSSIGDSEFAARTQMLRAGVMINKEESNHLHHPHHRKVGTVAQQGAAQKAVVFAFQIPAAAMFTTFATLAANLWSEIVREDNCSTGEMQFVHQARLPGAGTLKMEVAAAAVVAAAADGDFGIQTDFLATMTLSKFFLRQYRFIESYPFVS